MILPHHFVLSLISVLPRAAGRALLALGCLLLMISSARAQTSVVSGASYQPITAPGSIATLFGTNLSTQTIIGSPGADGTYPKQLGGITVTVGGAAADVFFVSPTQISFVVRPIAQYGSLNVVVASGAQTIASSTVTVSPTAPAIFQTAKGRSDKEGCREGFL